GASAGVPGGRAWCTSHTGCDRVGAGPSEVFGREVRRQDLDHRIVLDPDLDHVERPAIAGHTMPAGTLGDLFHFARVGRDADPRADFSFATRAGQFRPQVRSLARPASDTGSGPSLADPIPGGRRRANSSHSTVGMGTFCVWPLQAKDSWADTIARD